MKNWSRYAKAVVNLLVYAATVTLRPLFGIAGTCGYTVTCSAYTRYVFKHYSFFSACRKAFVRIMSCTVQVRW